jgi:Type I phosphodiesterase / nucleotide pyrophosphatase
MIEAGFAGTSPVCRLGSSECLVVLVADGVSYDVAVSCWSPTTLKGMTSTFPSTSSTALLSATTGLTPADHGVIGVAFRDRAMGAVFDCYADRIVGRCADVPRAAPRLGPWSTIFKRLAPEVESTAHPGALALTPGRWTQGLLDGATIMAPSADWAAIANDPLAIVNAAATDAERTLQERRARRRLVWVHVNLDSAIHIRGYDRAVRDAVATLGHLAERWAARGHTVIAHSDHGLVETRDSARARRLLTLLRDPALCDLTSGGAGRVLWAYSRPHATAELLARAREIAGDCCAIVSREELFRIGAIADTQFARERIGEVVMIATGLEFPMFSPHYRYEHGGISEQEMLVPFAIWQGH